MQAIETAYQGYRFRSRLEARWAVVFEHVGLEWRYEPEGFELPGAGRYLPDFWLETVGMWAEIKAGPFTPEEYAKCRALVEASGNGCLLLSGVPTPRPYLALEIHEGTVMETDAIIDNDYFHESRFFMSCGCDCAWQNREESCPTFDINPAPYAAARAARFEHGESPARPAWR